MTPERWLRIDVLCHAACEHASGSEREVFLSEACESDAELRREVESLPAQDASNGILDGPAIVPQNTTPASYTTLQGEGSRSGGHGLLSFRFDRFGCEKASLLPGHDWRTPKSVNQPADPAPFVRREEHKSSRHPAIFPAFPNTRHQPVRGCAAERSSTCPIS
jgi:hypothetical protein